MNFIYLVDNNSHSGYDVYDSFVVVAPSEEEAKLYNPYGNKYPSKDWDGSGSWVDNPEHVLVTRIGTASSDYKAGDIICSSCTAG